MNSNGLRDVLGFGVWAVVAVGWEIPGVGVRLGSVIGTGRIGEVPGRENPERGKMDPPLLDFSPHNDYMRRDNPRPTAGLALSVLTGMFHREWRRFLKG